MADGSPDEAQRNPGMIVTVAKPSPDCHPGYTLTQKCPKSEVLQANIFVSPI